MWGVVHEAQGLVLTAAELGDGGGDAEERHAQRGEDERADTRRALLNVVRGDVEDCGTARTGVGGFSRDARLACRVRVLGSRRGPPGCGGTGIGQTGLPVRPSWIIMPMMPIIAARPLLRSALSLNLLNRGAAS